METWGILSGWDCSWIGTLRPECKAKRSTSNKFIASNIYNAEQYLNQSVSFMSITGRTETEIRLGWEFMAGVGTAPILGVGRFLRGSQE